jgi:hypothetical protein
MIKWNAGFLFLGKYRNNCLQTKEYREYDKNPVQNTIG